MTTTTDMELEVANTILQQLGGSRFKVMTGAKQFTGSQNALSFKLPARFARDGIRFVRIRLDPSDTYTITFLANPTKANGAYSTRTVAEFNDIYCDHLQDVFTRTTGLATSLGTLGRKHNG